jgi:hypothetical protein
MDNSKRQLIGSESLDRFKRAHKDISSSFYALDGDFILVAKDPPGTVAYLDYRPYGYDVTFAEAIQYNIWMRQAPVFLVAGADPSSGPFIIFRYLGANWKPEPPICAVEYVTTCTDWPEFTEWESELRTEYRNRKGWNGFLRYIENPLELRADKDDEPAGY